MICDFSGSRCGDVCSRCGYALKRDYQQPPRRACPGPPGPAAATRALNFAIAAAKHVAAGSPLVSDAVVSARWAVCRQNRCGFFRGDDAVGVCLHKRCGCGLRTIGSESLIMPNKLRWAEQACPAGLWGPDPPAASG